jgi:hypothetical protein
MLRVTGVAAIVLGLLGATAPARGAPPGGVAGSASDGKLTERFSAGVAWWNAAGHYAVVGFFPSAPTAADRAAILKDKSLYPSTKGVAIEFGLKFKEGVSAAPMRSLERYYVFFFKYPANPLPTPMSLNVQHDDWTKGGGIQELSGELRKGGRLHGKFKYGQVYTASTTGPIAYQWDVECDIPLE